MTRRSEPSATLGRTPGMVNSLVGVWWTTQNPCTMPQRSSHTVSLPPDLEQFVETSVASGRYASSADLIGDAVRLLREQDQSTHLSFPDARAKIAVGLEQAQRGELLDGDEVFRELEAELSDTSS